MRALAAAICSAMALGAFAPGAFAEGYESKPEAADRDPDYAAGKKAIVEKRWEDAIASLSKAERRDPDNPDLQNWLGYANRNLKRYDPAFKHYGRAIELDPRHRGAREYLGETYLLVGDLGGAESQLAALKEICLLSCEEMQDLQKAIDAYKKTPK
jgi:Flp pilus assembly protein TadD